jgi:DNA-directed RNA polymerase specialized sigma24 family protein
MPHDFPETRLSAVRSLGSADAAERARAFEALVRAYWKPVYKHVRLKWRRTPDDAADATQGFFARAFEKSHLGGYDARRARFRTYLKASLDHYVLELTRDASRQKRGGGGLAVSLDFGAAEEELADSGMLLRGDDANAIEAVFDREWTRSLFGAAVGALDRTCTERGKAVYFDVFRRYVLEPEAGGAQPSYADVAAACGITVSDVTNYLSWARRELRARVIDELRAVTTDEDELREEARALLGIDL